MSKTIRMVTCCKCPAPVSWVQTNNNGYSYNPRETYYCYAHKPTGGI